MTREVHVHLTLNRGSAMWLLAGLFLVAGPLELGSETVTLQTYYPAPYGIYTQLRTMNLTTLAETGGSVAIGGNSAAGNLLRVVLTGGKTARFDGGDVLMTGGRLAVGTAGPDSTFDLDVVGTGVNGGKAHFAKYIKVGDQGCTLTDTSVTSSCGGYATWVPGIYAEGQWLQRRPNYPTAAFYTSSHKDDATTAAWRWWEELTNREVTHFYCCTK